MAHDLEEAPRSGLAYLAGDTKTKRERERERARAKTAAADQTRYYSRGLGIMGTLNGHLFWELHAHGKPQTSWVCGVAPSETNETWE